MRAFCPATIVEKYRDTDDSVVVSLAVGEEHRKHFDYRQGQHLTLCALIDGKRVRRNYSICASVAEDTLRLGVRIQEGGQFSNFLAEQLEVGDAIEVMPPSGHFYTSLDEQQQKAYAAFVAGSGITPILSIVKSTLETEPESTFQVFYGNRRRATTMFIEELWALKNTYPERLVLHFIMSQEASDIELYSGRLDGEKINALHAAFLNSKRPDDVFLCGPNPMIDELSAALSALGYPEERIHSERFRPGLRGETPPRPQFKAAPADGTEVTVVMDGSRHGFHMPADGSSILDAALEAGVELPYSCKGGVCSTCRCLLSEGDVDLALNYALEPWELEKGYILTCQSSPRTKTIELDFDQA